ncbi:phosphoribosylglycinamide formyltransferase [Paraburkholderia sp. A3BS-1L]|uniref:phosphoribosylglycinamide formyltransferase n=1 Tax=Paraburkholderia sp. A3BS-1L TaxID=3028375 RepID=UPI003DA8A858
MKNLVILISGRGSNMEAIVRACENEAWPARIAAVVANRPDAAGLAFAASHGIATAVVDHRQYPDRASFDTALAQVIDSHAPDLVVLAGFMRVLTEGFVQRYSGRMLNIHPSLLPSFPGLKTHEKAIDAGCRVHGATVHFVTPTLDHGPIVMQSAVPVRTGDDAAALAARVLKTEHVIYPRAVRWFVEGRLALDGERVTLTPPEAQWLFLDETSVEENAKTGAQAVKAGAPTHAGEGA